MPVLVVAKPGGSIDWIVLMKTMGDMGFDPANVLGLVLSAVSLYKQAIPSPRLTETSTESGEPDPLAELGTLRQHLVSLAEAWSGGSKDFGETFADNSIQETADLVHAVLVAEVLLRIERAASLVEDDEFRRALLASLRRRLMR